jgi:prolipoprotein diacylglyceryltransferase
MIQRLQSIFLLLASGSCFGLFGTDAADSKVILASSDLFADGRFNVFDSPVFIGAFALAGLIFLVDIFLFKNRNLQVKLASVALFIAGLGVGFGIYEYFSDIAADTTDAIVPDFGLAFPVLIVVFGVLARNYINKDEKLVRSADRLR